MKKKSQDSFPPISLIILAGIAFLYVPQYIPLLGTLWALFNPVPFGLSHYLINLLLLSIAIEMIFGKLPRWLCILPIFFFLGYFSFAVIENQKITKNADQIRSQLLALKTPFDAKRDSIVIQNKHFSQKSFQSNVASRLLIDYGIPVVYTPNKRYPPYNYMALRITNLDQCHYKKKYSEAATGLSLRRSQRKNQTTAYCEVRYPENPFGSIITMQKLLNKAEQISIEGKGQKHILKNAVVEKWPIVPRFMMECDASTYRDTYVGMFTIFIPPKIKKDCKLGFQKIDKLTLKDGKNKYDTYVQLIANSLSLKQLSYEQSLGRKTNDIDLEKIENRKIEKPTQR